ncbi:MAG: TonB-dependent receptor plug domain-containing protein, partial [Kordiimonadaceae bacterium]|nr:TonB-dependent receptor plug domain-containing protein [Kordiimonadaceae bacterium]
MPTTYHKNFLKMSASAATLLALVTTGGFNRVYAQDAETEETELEEVVVTGSRIRRDANVAGSAPVASVTSEQFRISGEIDITELLNDNPALSTSVTAENSVDSPFITGGSRSFALGQSILSLRGLGPERTLVLVNGRRHVSGASGTQSVDIGSTPAALIERVETLTGGASSVYGADAVTGVVNFILKDDYEGLSADVQASVADGGDAERYKASILYGKNFANDRGNFTVALDYSGSARVLEGDRGFSRDERVASAAFPNPLGRFQQGDITAGATPNLAQFYNPDNGFFSRGFRIPTTDGFIASYTDAFGSAPTLTAAETALFAQAAGAAPNAVLEQLAFNITSSYGTIAPADFGNPNIDLDGNGVNDCLDSFTGYNSSIAFNGFGFAGGCWVQTPDGIRPVRDGLIVGNFNHFGGDGILADQSFATLLPQNEKVAVNLNGTFQLTDNIRLFGEAKYVRQVTEYGGGSTIFTDLLTVSPDNPFIPTELQGVSNDAGGLFVTVDPTIGGNHFDKNTRETYRVVGGIDGEFDNGWNFELSANYGRFDQVNNSRAVLMDRFFAAIDVVSDVNGNPVCRSDSDPAAPPSTIFGIPTGDPGYFSFNPGDGSCQPLNVFGFASGGVSQAAADFVLYDAEAHFTQEQFVLSGYVAGDSGDWFELPGGAVGFVLGAEYRKEESSSTFDPLALGIAPVTTPTIQQGVSVGQNEAFSQESLLNGGAYDSGALVLDAGGSYDVYELFGEIDLPILSGVTFAEELRVNASARYSDYSTIGTTFVWSFGGVWSPV